ncbi:cell division protein FtsQ/DivIB [Corynebacterium liangguodongii]|uniref:Cell division protein n=1 Tax=Corynebacterium liangguodongii TaxID=2079535 RepID=A0A2S0WFB2_9CORY|nr:FtsQ-type POTRA domain-containing protein [Corynebacterium liangguodongii]AWB84352.1 cell division protein [Corynebacterium liangguodongii]PWB99842.1 cell division protein [Corynebacterium liangguodongii]
MGTRLKKHRGIITAVLVALGLCAVAAVVLPRTQVFAVQEVRVEGASQLAPEEVAAATGIAVGTPMGKVDTHAAAVGVAGLPWVKTVTVSRSWPRAVDVAVEENVAVAYTKSGDGEHLINAEGREFVTAPAPPGALEITGAAAKDPAVVEDAVGVVASISGKAREAATQIEARSPYMFVVRLADGRTVIWGAAEDNANKALALEAVLSREGREFNISDPQQIAVRP